MKADKENATRHYSNWVTTGINFCKPRNLFLYAGRGTAKSTDILASRSEDIVREMRNASFVFTSDTYMNLMTNVIPNIMQGWEERYDFYEGIHYVVDEAPPKSWGKPFGPNTLNYKHTISTYTGCKFFLTSLDRPSSNAGLSVQHVFGDESKYFREKKLNKLFPTLRGNPQYFGHSPYFLGKTFVSDMANPLIGEDDWMLRQEVNMNRKELVKAMQVGMVVNEIEFELYNAIENKYSAVSIKNIKRKLERWRERHIKARWGEKGEGNTFFGMVSSYVNADILTASYFDNMLKTLEMEEFKTAVLSMRKSLAANERFYARLSDKHFYLDGTDPKYFNRFGLRDTVENVSLCLKYCKHDEALECGVDFGNMCSMVIGQPFAGNEYRVIKEFHTLPPNWMRALADQFIDFFKHHRKKILFAKYDRAGNAYEKVKEDNAHKFKAFIEKDRFGKPTGWEVILGSIGQGNILHTEEYDLMNVMMEEVDARFEKIRIDAFNCKCLKSSLELAPVKPGTGKEKVQKVKTSEKLAPHRLPMESTNFSDAFKYLICTKDRLNYCTSAIVVRDYSPKVY